MSILQITANTSKRVGLPRWHSGKELMCNTATPGTQEMGFEEEGFQEDQSTPAFLPGKSHGQRSLEGYSPRGPKSQTRLSPAQQEWKRRLPFQLCLLHWQRQPRIVLCLLSLVFFLLLFFCDLFLLCFVFCCVVQLCGILVPWSWIKHILSVVKAQGPNHSTIREFPIISLVGTKDPREKRNDTFSKFNKPYNA